MIPEAPTSPSFTQGSAPQPSRASRAIMITTAVCGVLVLTAVGGTAAYAAASATASATSNDRTLTDTAGIRELDLDISAASFAVEYGPQDEASLQVTGPRSERWTLTRDGDTLTVGSPAGMASSCVFGFCPPGRGSATTATLTLPNSFAKLGLDVDVTVGAGSFEADGRFGELDVEVGAGEATITGAAHTVDVSVGVGEFRGTFADVAEADFSVEVGELVAQLKGKAPREVTVDVNLGNAVLELPDASYRVDRSVGLGDLSNELRTSADAPHLITASLELGELTLRPLR